MIRPRIRITSWALLAAPVAALATPALANGPTAQPPTSFQTELLAPQPLCEASAALAAPWDESLVLVADNEREEQLYVFELDDGELAPEEVLQMPARQRPEDIEALARLGEEVVIVGSHSRNRRCEADEDRLRLRRLARRQDGTLEAIGPSLDSAETWGQAMADAGACLSTLFTNPPPPEAGAVCAALIAAEQGASSGPCEVLNIEGAFGTQDGRLWLGLRAPQMEGRAVLLRLVAGFGELRFDRVALLKLEGRGIRELALAGDRLYGLAGPIPDSDVPFALFEAATDAVLAGGKPDVEILRRDLLTSSEGLLIRDGRAYVLVDGDEPEGGVECRKPAKWYTLDLP